MEIESVAKLAITFNMCTLRTSVRLDRSKDIDNFGICKPGVIIRKDGEFYLTLGSSINSDTVSIELVSLKTNEISSFDIDLDIIQIVIVRYHTNEDEEKEIVDALRCKVWNRMYHVVKRMFQHNFEHNDFFIMLGSKRSKLTTMQPLPKDERSKVVIKPGAPKHWYARLHNDRTNWRIYWYVRDHYARFIAPKLKAKSAVA